MSRRKAVGSLGRRWMKGGTVVDDGVSNCASGVGLVGGNEKLNGSM